MDNEIRSVPTDLKIVQRDDTSKPKQIQGYAILFNEESEYLGEQFYEIIKPGALDNVDLSQVQLLYGHETNSILARCDTGSLQLKVDDKGLFFVATLADTTLANDVFNDILAGNLKGCSFGFTTGNDSWSRTEDGTALHIITSLNELFEITITPRPAYQETSVAVKRSLDKIRKEKRDTMNIDPKQLADLIAQALAAQTEPVDDKQDKQATDAQRDDDSVEDLPDDDDSTDDGSDDSDEPEGRSKDAQEEDKPNKGKDTKETPEDDTEAPTASEDTPDDKGSEEQADGDSEDEPKDDNAEDSKDEPLDDKNKKAEERNQNMPQVITRDVNKTELEVRSYLDALRDVNKRDGVTVDSEGAILVPKQILDIQKTPNDPTQLAHYINRTVVSAPTGTLPVLAKTTARLVTKAELAKNPELAKASINSVDYKVQTYIGQLPISAEMLQDYPEAQSLVAQYLQEVKAGSEEAAIGKVLSTKFGANTANSLDDLKSAYNKLVNYGSDRVVVMSVSAFDTIDRLKDGEGRYYLQPSVTSPSGSTVFGAPIIITADETLGNAGDANIFVGSLKHAVVEAVRLDGLATSWAQNDYFEQVLSVATRFDVKQADVQAGTFINFNATEPAPAGK